MKRVVATIEARMGSSRLPGKTLKPIIGKPMLELMLERVKACKTLDTIVVATTIGEEDKRVCELAERMGMCWFRGSVDNVLSRVLGAAEENNADVIVELTGDCPLLDPQVTDQTVRAFLDGGYDYVSNNLKRTFPIGTETKVFSLKTLQEVNRLTQNKYDQEHVSLYIYEHPERYKLFNVAAPKELDRPDLRLTVDTEEDFAMITAVYRALYKTGSVFGLSEVIRFLDATPDVKNLNKEIKQKPVRY